jgi:hypothetical protein
MKKILLIIASLILTTGVFGAQSLSTFAGAVGAPGSADGYTGVTGTTCYVSHPRGVFVDNSGGATNANVIVADTGNCTIRSMTPSGGAVSTTLAGTPGVVGATNATGASASFSTPMGVTGTTFSSTYYYVVADTGNNLIRKVSLSGVVTTVAGSGACGSANGTGTSASFNQPTGVCTDGTNLYVADCGNNLIRKIVITSGAVTTLAGGGAGGISPGYINGTGTAAAFYSPTDVATDNTNVYVADSFNNCIRQIVIANGVTTTLAGSNANGTLTGTGSVSYNTPSNLTYDGSTKLYISDSRGSAVYSLVISTGVGALYAGTPNINGAYNGTTGTTSTSSFFYPRGIAAGSTTLFYIADTDNDLIRVAK